MNNKGLASAPEELENCKSFEALSCFSLPQHDDIPATERFLSHLHSLNICVPNKMICQLPKWLNSLICLTTLYRGQYNELGCSFDISHLFKISSLGILYLWGWARLLYLPDQLEHFTLLKYYALHGSIIWIRFQSGSETFHPLSIWSFLIAINWKNCLVYE